MSDLFPVPPPSTKYSQAFEECWKVHRVGDKKKAWKAGLKAGWNDGNWIWLRNYLEKRHREDAKWKEGYVLHLATIVNGERWFDEYPKIKGDRYDQAEAARAQQPRASEQEKAAAAAKALEQLRGMVH